MQLFKRIGATILVVIVIVSITASCFATPVSLGGIDFFTAAFQTFIEICGLTTVVSSNGVSSSSSDPYSQLQLTDQYQSLFDEYQASISSTDSISDWYTTYKDSIYVNIDSETSVISPTIDAQLSEWFSAFTGWILEDKYNAVRTDSGFSHTAGTFDSPLVSTGSFSLNGLPLQQAYVGLPIVVNYYGGTTLNITQLTAPSPVYMWTTPDSGTVSSLSLSSGFSYTTQPFGYGGPLNTGTVVIDGVTYYWGTSTLVSRILSGLPVLSFRSDQIPTDVVASDAVEVISLRPKDKYNEDAIPVPNVESDTYIPQALEGEYSDAITGALEGVVNPSIDDILQAVLDAVTENTEVIAEERVDPAPVNPVMPPFMPFDLPSFDFNLSGIWYYVVRWVNSIGSGAALLFNVFANIPAALFYPVFGSAVVVIVIGVWKRFIA